MHTRTPVLLLLPHTPKAHLPPQPDPATLLAAGRPWRARRLLLDGRVAEVRQQVGGTNASIAEWAAALGLLLLDRLFKPSTPPGPPNSVALPLPNAVTPWTLPVLLAAFVFHLGARVLCPTMRMPPPPPPPPRTLQLLHGHQEPHRPRAAGAGDRRLHLHRRGLQVSGAAAVAPPWHGRGSCGLIFRGVTGCCVGWAPLPRGTPLATGRPSPPLPPRPPRPPSPSVAL